MNVRQTDNYAELFFLLKVFKCLSLYGEGFGNFYFCDIWQWRTDAFRRSSNTFHIREMKGVIFTVTFWMNNKERNAKHFYAQTVFQLEKYKLN